jgi:hypothetical protein
MSGGMSQSTRIDLRHLSRGVSPKVRVRNFLDMAGLEDDDFVGDDEPMVSMPEPTADEMKKIKAYAKTHYKSEMKLIVKLMKHKLEKTQNKMTRYKNGDGPPLNYWHAMGDVKGKAWEARGKHLDQELADLQKLVKLAQSLVGIAMKDMAMKAKKRSCGRKNAMKAMKVKPAKAMKVMPAKDTKEKSMKAKTETLAMKAKAMKAKK